MQYLILKIKLYNCSLKWKYAESVREIFSLSWYLTEMVVICWWNVREIWQMSQNLPIQHSGCLSNNFTYIVIHMRMSQRTIIHQ